MYVAQAKPRLLPWYSNCSRPSRCFPVGRGGAGSHLARACSRYSSTAFSYLTRRNYPARASLSLVGKEDRLLIGSRIREGDMMDRRDKGGVVMESCIYKLQLLRFCILYLISFLCLFLSTFISLNHSLTQPCTYYSTTNGVFCFKARACSAVTPSCALLR